MFLPELMVAAVRMQGGWFGYPQLDALPPVGNLLVALGGVRSSVVLKDYYRN